MFWYEPSDAPGNFSGEGYAALRCILAGVNAFLLESIAVLLSASN